MATKPMRRCRWPTCLGLKRDASGYCEQHATIARQRDNARRNARRQGVGRTDNPRKAKERDG